jgi:hypothetical protein
MIRNLADINSAVLEGRTHYQRVLKNAGTAHALAWADPSFASGQPGYDAHVGAAGKFVPAVAQGNDSVFFPGIGPGQDRYLLRANLWSNQGTYNGPGSAVFFDLVGYYPLIDGDSTDTQIMDNSSALPRYEDGEGLAMVYVNHVAPAIQAGTVSIEYEDSSGATKTVTVTVANNGVNLVSTGSDGVSAAAVGAYAVPFANGSRGVRRILSVTYSVPPGGLHCIYLIKPLATMVLGDHLVSTEKEFTTKQGFSLPQILDGAWLGWLDRIGSGTARAVSWFGEFQFIWG